MPDSVPEQDLDNKVNDEYNKGLQEDKPGLLSKIASYGFLAATCGGAIAISGPVGAAAWTGAYLAAYLTEKKMKGITAENMRDQINAANIIQYPANWIFDFLAGATGVADKLILGLGITVPAFTFAYSALLYTLTQYNPKKLAKDLITFKWLAHPYKLLKEEIFPNYVNRLKNIYTYSVAFLAANWVIVPRALQIVGGAISNYSYRLTQSLFGKKQIGEYKTAASPA